MQISAFHSDKNLLSALIDASINPGNNGGSVFFQGKVVGITFQGSRRVKASDT